MTFSRRREIGLLLLVFAILGLSHWVVWQAYMPTWRTMFHGADGMFYLPLALTCVAWLLLSVALTARRCRETLLVPVVALLVGFGQLFLLRLAGGAISQGLPRGEDFYHLYQHQLAYFAMGWAVLLCMVLFWKEYRVLARYKYLIAATAVALLLVTTMLGKVVGDQQLTLRIGPLAFQPHDPVKLLLVVFLAAYLVEKRELLSVARGRAGWLTLMDLRYMGPLVALWVMVMAIVFIHKDLGAAALLFGAFLTILYLGTGRKTYVLLGLALFLLGMVFAYTKFDRVQMRVAIWQNPWKKFTVMKHGQPELVNYETKEGFQICQALMAMGNGRVVGAGLAGGYPERIPAVETDMIYAAVSEDLGLLGAAVFIGLFLVLIGRMFHVALQAEDRFGQLLAAGLAAAIAVQTFVILGGTVKLIPLTGVPLPFVSYGGTSLIVNMVLLGIVLKVAEEKNIATSSPN